MWYDRKPESATLEEVFWPLHAKATGFERPWSIAELRLTDQDVQWLRSWFTHLTPESTDNWIKSVTLSRFSDESYATYRQMFGALLICAAAEACRLESNEDSVWPAVRRILPDSHVLRRKLFLSNGQPSSITKILIEDAVRALNLRHAMDVEGTQQWFITIKLQYGFTYKGAKNRLAEWLVNLGRPHTVRYLNDEMGLPELASESFKSLWRAFIQYRRGLIGDEEVRHVLVSSPWVQSSWIDTLLIEAKSRIETLGIGEWHGDAESTTGECDTDEAFTPIADIELHWPPREEPRIRIVLDKARIEEQTDVPEIDVYVDSKKVARWLRQSNGSYTGEEGIYAEPQSAKRTPNLTPSVLTLSSRRGERIIEWDLTDSGLTSEVLVFDLDKRMLVRAGDERLEPSHHYALLCEKKSVIEGCQPVESFERRGVARKAIRLPAPLEETFAIIYEDFILWQPLRQVEDASASSTPIISTPGNSTFNLNDRTRLLVSGLPSNPESVRLLIHNKAYDLRAVGDGIWETSNEITLTPELASRQRLVRVRSMCDGSSRTFRPRLEFKLAAAAVLRADGRQDATHLKMHPLKPGAEVNRSKGTSLLRVWVPDATPNPYVHEGHYRAGRSRHGRMALSELSGFGESLNVHSDERIYHLDVRSLDRGCVAKFQPSMLGSPASLHLSIAKEYDEAGEEGYSVWYWTAEGGAKARPKKLPTERILTSSTNHIWKLELTDYPMAVALTWKGYWLGAWWDLERIREYIDGRPDLAETDYAMFKWLRAPVFHPSLVTVLAPRIVHSPCRFLRAWLVDSSLPTGLEQHEHISGTDFVVRHFLWTGFPPAHAREAIRALTNWDGNMSNPERCIGMLDTLSTVSPILVWKCLELFLQRDRTRILDLLRAFVCTGLGLSKSSSNQQIRRRLEYLEEAAARFAQLDRDYLSDLVRAWMDSMRNQIWKPNDGNRDDTAKVGESPSGRKYISTSICCYWLSLSGEEGIWD